MRGFVKSRDRVCGTFEWFKMHRDHSGKGRGARKRAREENEGSKGTDGLGMNWDTYCELARKDGQEDGDAVHGG